MRSGMVVGWGLALGAAVVLCSPASFARRVRCGDVQAAQAAGKTVEQITADLGITETRIQACARMAAQREERAARRARVHRERAERRAR